MTLQCKLLPNAANVDRSHLTRAESGVQTTRLTYSILQNGPAIETELLLQQAPDRERVTLTKVDSSDICLIFLYHVELNRTQGHALTPHPDVISCCWIP